MPALVPNLAAPGIIPVPRRSGDLYRFLGHLAFPDAEGTEFGGIIIPGRYQDVVGVGLAGVGDVGARMGDDILVELAGDREHGGEGTWRRGHIRACSRESWTAPSQAYTSRTAARGSVGSSARHS